MRLKHFADLADTRRTPRTSRYCVMCQRELRAGSTCYEVRLLNNEYTLIHPEDWDEAKAPEQSFLVGPECMKKMALTYLTHQAPDHLPARSRRFK